jgi:hypothetical protein
MTAEFDIQMAAQHHQNELLAEADARRLTHMAGLRREAQPRIGRRLQTLLRRLAGAPAVA